jgi:hypothetical protein
MTCVTDEITTHCRNRKTGWLEQLDRANTKDAWAHRPSIGLASHTTAFLWSSSSNSSNSSSSSSSSSRMLIAQYKED